MRNSRRGRALGRRSGRQSDRGCCSARNGLLVFQDLIAEVQQNPDRFAIGRIFGRFAQRNQGLVRLPAAEQLISKQQLQIGIIRINYDLGRQGRDLLLENLFLLLEAPRIVHGFLALVLLDPRLDRLDHADQHGSQCRRGGVIIALGKQGLGIGER